jgi:hypothetical protein
LCTTGQRSGSSRPRRPPVGGAHDCALQGSAAALLAPSDFGRAELELKKLADGESAATALTNWALRHRFTQPGTQLPFEDYIYAEDAPLDETVP